MAHIQTPYLNLWHPQDLAVDKINSQKMFVDNIDTIEDFAKVTMQKVHQPVQNLAALRAIDTSDTTLFTTGMLIMVYEYGMYYFDRNSTADESNAIVAPTTGGGRWITTQITDIALSPREVANAAALDTLLTNTVEYNMSPNSIKFLLVKGMTEFNPLYGGTAHVIINKVSNLYASLTLTMYNDNRITKQLTRARYDGIWGRWVTVPFLDANGKIPVDQLPVTSALVEATVE